MSRGVERSDDRGDRRRQHRERHDGRDDDIRERRDERETLEIAEDDRQGRELSCRGQRERLAQERRPALQASLDRSREDDQAGGREQGELEPDVPEDRRGDEEHPERRQHQGRGGVRR